MKKKQRVTVSNISCQIHLNNLPAPAVTDSHAGETARRARPEMAHAEIRLTSGVGSRRGRGGATSSVCEQSVELQEGETGRALILLLLCLSFLKTADRLSENRGVTGNAVLHPPCWVCWEPSLITYAGAPNR